MKNTAACHCQSACKNKRCPCLRAGKSCSASCQCANCENSLNGPEAAPLSDCARDHITKISRLSERALNQEYELPCGCEKAMLKDLIEEYTCSGCGEIYYYSFCVSEAIDAHSMWHCLDCKVCREDSEWHCKRCNDCTYGLTLKCDSCGKKSPYMP